MTLRNDMDGTVPSRAPEARELRSSELRHCCRHMPQVSTWLYRSLVDAVRRDNRLTWWQGGVDPIAFGALEPSRGAAVAVR